MDWVNIRIKDGGAQASKQRKKGSGTFRGVSNYPVPQATVTPAVSPKQIVSALNISREQCTTFWKCQSLNVTSVFIVIILHLPTS